uniref:Uncharacterized protein n=1 Tax=Anguilla anguilla TaxID=7936 RepID=A0A0E9RTM3_ANGAN
MTEQPTITQIASSGKSAKLQLRLPWTEAIRLWVYSSAFPQ